MKYLCLIYFEEKKVAAMPAEELERIAAECARYNESLAQRGHLIAVARLQPVASAITLRRANGNVSAIDGPFAETKEQLGGFYFIEAGSQEEAVAIASKIPPGELGCVEVRPLGELPE